MEESKAVWYLPGEGDQPTGPFTTDQVLEKCRTGQLHGATLCWQQGMPHWRPLAEVEPFREALPPKIANTTHVADVAKRGMKEIGKAFGKAMTTARKKAKITSLKLSISQHEKRKRQILYELGKLLYESSSDLLSESPYTEKVQLAKAQEQTILQLHQQIDALEKPKPAQHEKVPEPDKADE